MKQFFTFLFLFVFIGATTFAQEFGKQNVDRNGNPTFVKFDAKAQSVSKSETKAVLSNLLNMTNNDKYKTMKSEKDQIGYTHEKFQQYFKGIKVINGIYIVHSRNEVIESVNGDYKLINDINVTPSVSSTQAIENAKAFINAKVYMKEDKATDSKPELVIVEHNFGKHPKDVHAMVLAYRVDIYATQPLSRDYVYVSAHTGEIVHVNAILVTAVETGSADTRYSGTKSITTDSYNGSYRLRDYSRGNGIITYNCNESTSYTSAVDFTDANNTWTAAEYDNADKDNGALDAHWAGMVTYDYFKNIHSRNSFDGNNALIKTYVHFDDSYDNAYWNGSVFTFGDGTDFDILTSLDVFGHEFGHAVCSYTADLNYENESGALNEAFSDIWGCVIEYYNAPTKDTWLMGEDLGSALRSLEDPKSKGLPDTYMGTNWYPLAASPDRYNDYGGVHYNNGPFCHWFYLISEGGSGTNDNNDSYSVTAIGIEKAEKIAYRVESVYMTSTSNYASARTYSIQAAQDLYGVDSQEEISVTNAMYAVGVGEAYGGTTPPVSSTYCESEGTNFSYEWIAQVQLGSFTKSSAGAAYSDFTSSTINVNAGGTYAVTLTPGYASTTYDEYWKIWIDYNNDTIFDANELVYDAGALSKVAVSGNITIQSGISGVRRMRVSMKYNAAQTACETFAYGEVEDYNITIGGGTPDTQAPTAPTNLSSSNITETSLSLSWTASTDNVGVTAYDVYQNGSLLGSVTGTSGDITGLTAATTYAYYVKAKDAAANVSSASSTLNVTTSSTAATTDLTLTITFDNYPEETSWTLKNSGGTSVASGGTYASQADGSTLVIPINGLENDCYVFTMLDAYSDGICCTYGSGSYTLEVTGGATIKSGASFGASEVTNFCIPYTSFNFAATTSSFDKVITKPAVNIYPNPANSYINVQVTNAKANGMISIYSVTGALVKLVEMDESEREINISELPSGLYLITVDTKKEAITKHFIKK
ncbi:MAG: T9SS type A sorting domain-containing protein [Bacteroidales bacterium]|nr:T9SS type A sorting domain-containing protein [Bacteroidales bacterium]